MPDIALVLFIASIVLALGLGFANGLNDAANAIADVVATRVLTMRAAVTMAGILNFAGAATGTAVAYTIGKNILRPEELSREFTQCAVIAALCAVVIWVSLSTRWGMPVSSSHSLVVALAGAGVAFGGTGSVVWGVLTRIMSAVVCAPVLGFVGGFVIMILLMWLFRRSAPSKVNGVSSKLLIVSSAFMAYTHGKNDGQMPMGIIALTLMGYYGWTEFHIPMWVVIISALSISLGTAIGGKRVIGTVGLKITKLSPVHGFAADMSAAVVVEGASLLGIPVSTTHCISAALMGVGSTKRFSAVRWGVARSIVIAWVITFPVCVGLGWGIAQLLKHFVI